MIITFFWWSWSQTCFMTFNGQSAHQQWPQRHCDSFIQLRLDNTWRFRGLIHLSPQYLSMATQHRTIWHCQPSISHPWTCPSCHKSCSHSHGESLPRRIWPLPGQSPDLAFFSSQHLHISINPATYTHGGWPYTQSSPEDWNEDLRQQFCNAINDPNLFAGDGSEFVVLDETSKNEHTWARTHGRSLSGERAQLEDVFVWGDRFSLLAALTIEGYMAVRVVEGFFDAHEFLDFVQEEVVHRTYLSHFSC